MKPLTHFALLASFVSLVSQSYAILSYDIKLYNASGHLVELIDKATGRSWATIPAGRARSFLYWEGVALRSSGHQLIYTRVDPPRQFISVGLFSTSFKAQLASDLRIYLLPLSVSPPAAHLPAQPKGFPLRPTHMGLTSRSSQPLAVLMFSLQMTSTLPSAEKADRASGG